MEASAKIPLPQRVNWSMVFRVGLVSGLVLLLVGFALYQTFFIVMKGGVIDRGDYFEVDLRSMGNFDLDQNGATIADIPSRYRELDGKKVLLQGEIAPGGLTSGSKVSEFQLCYSVATCCFGGPPKVQHFVTCTTLDGKQVTNYFGAGQVKVFGTLHVKVIRAGGAVQSIYQLDLERVEPVS